MSSDAAIPVALQGVSGTKYEHRAHARNSSWNAVAGNYSILKHVNGGWTVLYVGETENLSGRMANHHRQSCFDRNGWTHLAFRAELSAEARKRIEADLMQFYKSVCNREV